jgi:hypothetical protein
MSVTLTEAYSLRSLYRFECTTLNEIEIVPYFIKHNACLIVAMTGLDGYFRVVKLEEIETLFSFRSDFGGFNSFAFNSDYTKVYLQ